MQTVHMLEKTGKDGVLNLSIPVGTPDAECEVVVVVRQKESADRQTTPEERGWPPGYFERTAGSIDDETFFRHPQGEYRKPVDFE